MAMLIPQDAKQCSVCYENFDINNRLPMLLECQHNICKVCLKILFETRRSIKCPICRTDDKREYSSITNNRFLVQLLENELKIPQVPSLNSNNDNNNNKKKQLQDIINEYEINKRYAQKLQILQDFKIVFILDDSGSMNTPLNESPLLSNNNNNNEINLNKKITRWDELHYFSNIMLEIANFFNPNGCDVYFLNRNSSLNVKDKEQLSRLFSLESPQGFTPLTSKLNEALNDNLFQLNNRKLLIIIITDGEPTDSEGTINIKEFKDCLLKRPSNVYTTIAACTDDDLSVEYLNNWDKEIPRLDIVDDYRSEKAQVIQRNGKDFSFTVGSYIVKSMIGSIDPDLDEID